MPGPWDPREDSGDDAESDRRAQEPKERSDGVAGAAPPSSGHDGTEAGPGDDVAEQSTESSEGRERPPAARGPSDDPTPAVREDQGSARELDELVEAARSIDPGADALPSDLERAAPRTDPGGPVPTAAELGDEPRSRRETAGPGADAPAADPVHDPSATAPQEDGGTPTGSVAAEGLPSRADHGRRPRQDVLRPGGGPPVRRPARVIAMANQKGGVGKTTSVINLGAALAELGNRVLLVDMDPQGSLGVGIGAEPHTLERTIYNLLMADGTAPDEVILQTAFDNLHVLPSNIDLAAAEIMLVQEVAREQSLRRVVDRLRYRYDHILVDCPPSLGLLTINGLTAANGVMIPLECEYFALRGMTLLMNTIRKVQERLNPELEIEGILATMVDTRTIHAREVLERVHEAFGNLVFKSTINKTIRFAEAPVSGEPILTYAAENRGADAYRELAREVLSR